MTPRILTVPEIVTLWSEIEPLLASVGGCRRYWSSTPLATLTRFEKGEWTLWVIGDPIEALCAVGIAKESDGTLSLRLEQVAGRADWRACIGPIRAWAFRQGCVRIVMPRARPGWARMFRDFKVRALYLEQSI